MSQSIERDESEYRERNESQPRQYWLLLEDLPTLTSN